MYVISRLPDFFNNATIAAVVAIGLGALIANSLYKSQKRLDRESEVKRDLINSITELQVKCKYALLLIDRIANTYLQKTNTDEEFLEALQQSDLPRLSNTVNEEIPSLEIGISPRIQTYFHGNKKVVDKYEIFKKELKDWHEIILTVQFDFRKRVSEQEKLKLDKTNEEIKSLVKIIWDEPVSK